MGSLVLALDQGTSSSRAILFDEQGRVVANAQRELAASYPQDGWVEQDPEAIWQTCVEVCRDALARTPRGDSVVAMGITNQRETIVLWERSTGRALANAIVWQDRRTADACARLRADGREPWLVERTGLLADPYFSASKLRWLLDHAPGARAMAARGELAAGTIDSFLLWRLSGGQVHRTDATNASRTQLLNLRTAAWDEELLRLFDVPADLLPQVSDSAGAIGTVQTQCFGLALPVTGVAGDQQAALVGQACLTRGMTKSTYGTGCFALTNTGATAQRSANRLLGTIAYQLNGTCTYGLEGSIFVAGAAVQWLRDRLGVIRHAADTQGVAQARGGDARGVYVVPAFVGLGAPYWDAGARGTITGLSLDSGWEDIVVATLQSVAFQTQDLLAAARRDGAALAVLRVDGGMVANDWLCQFIADIIDLPVERPVVQETTALGAAMLAALGAGLVPSLEALGGWWQSQRRFEPAMAATRRDQLLAGWQAAVARSRAAPDG